MDFNQANDYTNKLLNTNWVKWIHEGSVPAKSNRLKAFNVLLGTISKHCPKCLNLNDCCFVRENVQPFQFTLIVIVKLLILKELILQQIVQ